MKFSLYNIICEYEHEFLLYNTYSTAFIKVPQIRWNEIEAVINDGKPIAQHLKELVERLCKNGFIVPKDADEVKEIEYRFYSKMFSDSSLNLSIAPTMKCNFNCFYCFEEGNKNFGLMPVDIADNLVQYISSQKGKAVNIHWFGGEPLLGFKQILHISRRLNEKDVNYTSTIITNGSLLSKRNIVCLKELKLQYIQISLDGKAEEHDKRRTFKNGKPTFQLIINNLRNLMEMTDIKVCIHVTVDHSNETAYKDVVDYMLIHFKKYIDSKRITIGHNYVLNRTNFDTEGSRFTPSQILNDEINALRGKSGTTNKVALPGLSSPCMFRCRNSYAIDSLGNIYQCLEHLGNPSYKIGSLKDGKISMKKNN